MTSIQTFLACLVTDLAQQPHDLDGLGYDLRASALTRADALQAWARVCDLAFYGCGSPTTGADRRARTAAAKFRSRAAADAATELLLADEDLAPLPVRMMAEAVAGRSGSTAAQAVRWAARVRAKPSARTTEAREIAAILAPLADAVALAPRR